MRQDEILTILKNSVSPLTKYDIIERAGISEEEARSTNWGRRFRSLERWGEIRRAGIDPDTRCQRWEAVR